MRITKRSRWSTRPARGQTRQQLLDGHGQRKVVAAAGLAPSMLGGSSVTRP